MKKNLWSQLWYVFWGVIFFLRVAFLILHLKGLDQEFFQYLQRETVANQRQEELLLEQEKLLEEEKLLAQKEVERQAEQEAEEERIKQQEAQLALNQEMLSWFLQQQEESITTGMLDSLSNIKEKIEVLEQLYAQDPTIDNVEMLLNAYVLWNQYDKARKVYAKLDTIWRSQLPQTLDFEILINAFSLTSDEEYRNLKKLLQEKYKNHLFTDWEKDYYDSVFLLIDGDYEAAEKKLESLKNTKYSNYVDSINAAFTQYESLKDVPEYYRDGLVAYQLMNNWFLVWAKKIAVDLVNKYPKYILPYQILANVDFTLWKWTSASQYFLKLLELDYQEKNLYNYHLGVCYYNLWRYSDAVLYLAQITDPSILLDSDRYLVLSYIALGEEDRIFAWWQRLLGYPSVKATDFYSFFEEALWKPYRLWKKSSYLVKNGKLVQAYFTMCPKKLKWNDALICVYGQLGLAANQKKFSDIELQVSRFARKFPKSHLFQLLGDIQLSKWETAKASDSFMRALDLAKQGNEKAYLRKRILEVNELE